MVKYTYGFDLYYRLFITTLALKHARHFDVITKNAPHWGALALKVVPNITTASNNHTRITGMARINKIVAMNTNNVVRNKSSNMRAIFSIIKVILFINFMIYLWINETEHCSTKLSL